MKTIKFTPKKKILAICCVFSLLFVSVMFAFFSTKKSTNYPKQISSTYNHVIDIENFAEVAGFVDYIFIGKITEQTEIINEGEFKFETLTGTETINRPATKYAVRVLENIKGTLNTAEDIEIIKSGGLTSNGKYLFLEIGDFLPEAGDICIFFSTVDENGNLYIEGKAFNFKLLNFNNSTKTINESMEKIINEKLKQIREMDIYKEVVSGFENEIEFQRERFSVLAEYK